MRARTLQYQWLRSWRMRVESWLKQRCITIRNIYGLPTKATPNSFEARAAFLAMRSSARRMIPFWPIQKGKSARLCNHQERRKGTLLDFFVAKKNAFLTKYC